LSYTLGATHTVSGSGSFAIAKPAGLLVALSSLPSSVGSRVGTPTEIYGAGRISLGTADGYLPRISLHHSPQLLYPIGLGMTLLAYDLVAGATAVVTELVEVVDPHELAPWDRNATYWSQSTVGGPNGGTVLTVGWTYTVPAGRILMLEYAFVQLVRVTAATVIANLVAYIAVAGSRILSCGDTSNVVGSRQVDVLAAGPVFLPAGTVIAFSFSCADTGGTSTARGFACGTLFDA
jgi:hypothetical protein